MKENGTAQHPVGKRSGFPQKSGKRRSVGVRIWGKIEAMGGHLRLADRSAVPAWGSECSRMSGHQSLALTEIRFPRGASFGC